MLRWGHEHEDIPARLARGAATTRLGAEATGLETARYRRGLGSDARCGLPMAVRTWAPCGQTPVLTVPLTHDHLSVISGITSQGRLFLQTQERAYHSEDVVGFLRVLLRKIQGKLLVLWDGAPIHRGQPIK